MESNVLRGIKRKRTESKKKKKSDDGKQSSSKRIKSTAATKTTPPTAGPDVYVISLTDPLRSLNKVPKEYLLIAMNEYVLAYYESGLHKAYETGSRKTPKEFVNQYFLKLFNVLRYVFPWKLTVEFIREYNERRDGGGGGVSAIDLLKEYLARERTQTLLRRSKEFIKSRRGIDYGVERPLREGRKVVQLRGGEEITVPTTNVVRPASTIMYMHDVRPRRVQRFLEPQDLLSRCELYFRHADWMPEKRIVATLLRVNSDEAIRYGTNFNVTPQWVRAKSSWYKYPCDVKTYGKRLPFRENVVAYLTRDDEIIVETKDMYDKSVELLGKQMHNVELTEIYPQMIRKVVFDMLKDNAHLVKSGMDLNALTNAIVQNEDDIDLTRDSLARTLVYLQRIIKQPQVHIERVENGMYDEKTLLRLTRDSVLPEVFKNTNVDQRVVERVHAIVQSKWNRIIREFDRRLNEERAPAMSKAFRPLSTYVPELIYPLIEDPKPLIVPSCSKLYYVEDGVTYTFSLNQVEDETHNPRTGKAFSKEFLAEIKLLSSKSLADGLFERVRDDLLNLNLMCQCSTCDVAINPFETRYTSRAASTRVNFCDARCFERFTFF